DSQTAQGGTLLDDGNAFDEQRMHAGYRRAVGQEASTTLAETNAHRVKASLAGLEQRPVHLHRIDRRWHAAAHPVGCAVVAMANENVRQADARQWTHSRWPPLTHSGCCPELLDRGGTDLGLLDEGLHVRARRETARATLRQCQHLQSLVVQRVPDVG